MTHCREEDYPNLFTVYTFRQTAGRGQAGNAWESEPGKNLSFSTLVHIHTIEEASRLNMLVPLAVVRALLKVKGPQRSRSSGAQCRKEKSKVKGRETRVKAGRCIGPRSRANRESLFQKFF